MSGQLELWDGGRAEGRNGGTTPHRWASRHGSGAPERSALPPSSRSTPLQRALDRIHSRYGARGMTRGSQLAALTTRATP